MVQQSRRAAGTRTMGDVLLRWAWIRRRTPEGDLRDLDAGMTLQVAGFTKTLGGSVVRSIGKGRTITLLRSGRLSLTAGQEPVWRDRRQRDRTAVLRGPVELVGEGERQPGAWQFARFEVTTADGRHDIAVPKIDVPLVRYAFSTVRPAGD